MRVVLNVVKGPHEGRSFEFDEHDTFIVGRAPTAQFHLADDDPFFSRNHFLVEVNPPLCRILDLDSRNGTFVNGQRVSAIDLKNGDRIRGGRTVIRVAVDEKPAPAEATIVPQNCPRKVDDKTVANPDSTLADGATFISGSPQSRGVQEDQVSDAQLPQFPGYQTLQLIGRGGMGCVYEARSCTDEKRVAIKVVSTHAAATENDTARFMREAEILKTLDHTNIVRYHELKKNERDGSLYIVMHYVAGSNAELILRELTRPISVHRALAWMMQLLEALKYAHERGYIHRDVKPSNLLIAGSGEREKLYLADFGLARAYQASKLSGLTVTGEIGGSTPYMPPEQITSYRNVDPSADQYSVAATLYYLLSKENVYDFPKDTARQLLLILQEDPVPLQLRRPELPEPLVRVIHRALSRHPSQRFEDLEAFQQALAATQTDS